MGIKNMICRPLPQPWPKIWRLERLVKKLRAERAELHELIAPFVLHGLAQKVFDRKNTRVVISKIGGSSLDAGAFQMLIEFLDPKEWPVIALHTKEPERRRRKRLRQQVLRTKAKA